MEEGRRTKTVRLKPVNIDECVLWKLHPNSEEPRTPSIMSGTQLYCDTDRRIGIRILKWLCSAKAAISWRNGCSASGCLSCSKTSHT